MGGGLNLSSRRYEILRTKSVKRASVIVALIALAYVILAELGLASVSSYYDSLIAWSITVIFIVLLVAVWKPLMYGPGARFSYLFALHLIGALYVLLVSGFMSPVTLLWLYFAMMSDAHYSKRATTISLLFIFAVMLAALAINQPVSQYELIAHLVYTSVISVIGWFMRDIRRVQSTEHDELVTTQKRELSQKTQLLALINSVPQAIISVDPNGIIQLYNAAALDLLDTNKSLTGSSLNDVLHTINDDKEPVNFIEELKKLQHNNQRDDLAHRYQDGDTARLDISSSILYGPGNEVDGYILVMRDVTKEKTLDEERDEFISVVSHELRTPITITEGTISNLQLLIEKGATPTVVNESVKSAHQQIVYLARMVNDLSTLSRAERGVGDVKELIDLKTLAEQLYTEFTPRTKENNLTLNLDVPNQRMQVYASRLYLEEMLQNFITNAIKYTKEGSVTLRISPLGLNSANIEVSDTGIGISKSDQKKIFEKFYRSEDYRTRETSGTGLGLYVVQKLANKLGVLISLDSMPGKGSTFSFTIPLADKEEILQAKNQSIDNGGSHE